MEPLYPEGEEEASLNEHVEYPSTNVYMFGDRLGKDREKDDAHIPREKANNEFALADLDLSTQICLVMKK